MLEVKELTKSYRDNKRVAVANNRLNFTAKPGELVWIYGNSGSGKSTFLNLLTGLDSADSGSVHWDDFHIESMSAAERSDFRLERCGIIFQFF